MPTKSRDSAAGGLRTTWWSSACRFREGIESLLGEGDECLRKLVRHKPTAYGRATLTGSAVPASLSRPSAGVPYRDCANL
jgi:hypothetical protein